MRGRLPLALAAPLLAAGCAGLDLASLSGPPPQSRPAVAATPAPEPAAPAPERSEISAALVTYYGGVQSALVARGLLRRDRDGPDVPFDADTLARNFIQIALFEEYTVVGGRLVERQVPGRLSRWAGPVRVGMVFGDTVPPGQAARDRAAVAALLDRLSAAAGIDIRLTGGDGNFTVFVVNEDERRRLGPRLDGLVPGVSDAALDTVVNLPRSSYCIVLASDPRDEGIYDRAVAVVRAEHPDLLRLSCLHEEIAQGLGLSNDSPLARPSIFNDDEEFALLTRHDELLLRILYDRRLSPGMDAETARPIVRRIAGELLATPT